MSKPIYAKLELSEDELKQIRQAVIRNRERCFSNQMKVVGKKGKETELRHYENYVRELDALLEVIEQPFINDISQDDEG